MTVSDFNSKYPGNFTINDGLVSKLASATIHRPVLAALYCTCGADLVRISSLKLDKGVPKTVIKDYVSVVMDDYPNLQAVFGRIPVDLALGNRPAGEYDLTGSHDMVLEITSVARELSSAYDGYGDNIAVLVGRLDRAAQSLPSIFRTLESMLRSQTETIESIRDWQKEEDVKDKDRALIQGLGEIEYHAPNRADAQLMAAFGALVEHSRGRISDLSEMLESLVNTGDFNTTFATLKLL